jgi:glycerophosphoryl diester phosphodiesterase
MVPGCTESINLPSVIVVGHGGAGFYAIQNSFPANSQASIEQALFMQGANGVEVDIQLTADGKIVLYHDDRLETSTTGVGYISEMKLEDLSSMTYRGNIDKSKKHSIMTLSDLVDLLQEAEKVFVVSLHLHPQLEIVNQDTYHAAFKNALRLSLIRFHGRVIIESPDRKMLEILAVPGPWGQIADIYYDARANDENIQFALDNNLKGLVSNYLDESSSSMKKAEDANLKMVLYGLKIRRDIVGALELSPYMVQSDNVPLTMDILGR